MKKEIQLGNQVECRITGYKGIAISRLEHINGCVQYCVKRKVKEDEKMPEGEWIDDQQLEVIGDGIQLDKTDHPGGPSKKDMPKQ